MARLKAIESRSGFRYGGVSGLGAQNDFAVHDFALSAMIQWAGGCFVGGTPTLLEGAVAISFPLGRGRSPRCPKLQARSAVSSR